MPRAARKTTEQDQMLNAPWSLHFDRDGTEDIGIIIDAKGHDLVTSRHFWLPAGDEPMPATLAALYAIRATPAMHAALEACEAMLRDYRWLVETVAGKFSEDAALAKRIDRVRMNALLALCDARGEIVF